MDPKKLPKESKNFVDHTNRSPAQEFLDNVLIAFNPVYALRNIRQRLIQNGTIDVPGAAEMAGRANAQTWMQQEQLRQQQMRESMPAGGLTADELQAIVNHMRSKTMKK